MATAMQVLHWLAGLLVLAEALNKLERTAPLARGLSATARLVDALKALAWLLLALGGAGAVVGPALVALGVGALPMEQMAHRVPTLAETATLLGFAVLIIRTRVKEG